MPAQQRIVDETLLQYNAMQIGVFDLLQSKREQLELQLAEVEAIERYWQSRAAYDALLAGKRVGMDNEGMRTTLEPAMRDAGGGH
jgi:outer membrane protein TolC